MSESFKKLEGQLEQDLPNVFGFIKQVVKSAMNDSEELPTRNDRRQLEPSGSNVVTICATCQGRKKLGNEGHEINCPICANCKTCGGKGKLGAENHEINCPVCSP